MHFHHINDLFDLFVEVGLIAPDARQEDMLLTLLVHLRPHAGKLSLQALEVAFVFREIIPKLECHELIVELSWAPALSEHETLARAY
jgi:hypothetical protein